MNPNESTPAAEAGAVRRQRLLRLGLALGLVALGGASHVLLTDRHDRSTDDAYVSGHVVAVTPQVAGTVVRVGADNTDRVTAGEPLVEVDPTDARVELASAEADLARAVRHVRGLFATDARFDAEVHVADVALDKARADLQQRQAIAGTGAVPGEDVRHARDAVRSAEASLAAARQARAQALSQTQGTTLASHPDVQAAAQRVRSAALALARTRIVAPVGGMVAQRSVQPGRRIAPGDKLMSVVPLDGLWIDANFKEVQLEGMCPGQPATITADIYGRNIVYHGRIADIEAGSGAAFALLPAQNATGNWIKVVQRVPVRILLDPSELQDHPLRIGLSVKVTVDTGHCDRASKPAAPRPAALAPYASQAQEADAAVARVIAANLGS